MPKSKPTEASLAALTMALKPVERAWRQAAIQALGRFGVSMPVASAVIFVSRRTGGVGQGELAEEIGVNGGAMVRTIDQAEKAGLLERRAVDGDRRANSIHLRPDGVRLAAQMEAALAGLRSELLGDFPAEEVETTLQILRRIEERCSARQRLESDGK